MTDLFEGGHQYVDVEIIDLYLKKKGIQNVNLLNYMNKSLSYMQDILCTKNQILLPANSKIHNEIINIIKENNFFNEYITKKDIIISKMLYKNKNLKKANKKKINNFKKQITDALESKRLLHSISFENK